MMDMRAYPSFLTFLLLLQACTSEPKEEPHELNLPGSASLRPCNLRRANALLEKDRR